MAHIATLGAALAHQGGWDEVLLVGAPIAIIVAVLAIAKRRVDLHEHEQEHQQQPGDGRGSDAEPAGDDGAPGTAG